MRNKYTQILQQRRINVMRNLHDNVQQDLLKELQSIFKPLKDGRASVIFKQLLKGD